MVDRDVRMTRRVVVRHAAQPSSTGIPTSRSASEPIPATAPSEHNDNPDEQNKAGDNASEKPVLGTMRAPALPEGLEATLAGQDAEAADLRAQLDELRRRLDTPLPPLSPVAARRRRGPLLGLLVVGGTIGVVATATLVPWSNLDLTGRDGGSAAAGAAPAAAPRAVPAAPITPIRASGLPATGPGVDAPGTAMVVRVGRDGALQVTEVAVLGARGLRRLDLALPSLTPLGGGVARLDQGVSGLQVKVNGSPAAATPNAAGTGWTVTADAARARQVELSYRLTGSLIRSRAGRALALVQPLLGESLRAQGLPLVVRGEGAAVEGATCPGAGAAMLCGQQDKTGWVTEIPAEATSPAVLLQLTWD